MGHTNRTKTCQASPQNPSSEPVTRCCRPVSRTHEKAAEACKPERQFSKSERYNPQYIPNVSSPFLAFFHLMRLKNGVWHEMATHRIHARMIGYSVYVAFVLSVPLTPQKHFPLLHGDI